MIFLPAFYSDHALFQHSSTLTIKGKTDGRTTVYAKITAGGITLSEGSCTPDEGGCFDIALRTPAASRTPREITVTCGEESVILSDILFGELWLACGQSNMQMTNASQDGKEKMREEIAKRDVRFLHFKLPENDAAFPYSPVSAYEAELDCRWAGGDDEYFYDVSAAATAFSLSLYDYLSAQGDIPVGFACTCKGGSSIETWVPRSELSGEEIRLFLDGTGKTVTPESWNGKGTANYQQPGAYYNYMMEALCGLKARGMLWYQGETNAEYEYSYRVYDKLMIALRDSYKARYGMEGEPFPVISSLIYPWTYGRSGECQVGYINDALVRLARERAGEFFATPIGDLPFSWDFARCNHPIHPTHKYALGARLAELTKRNVYGQKSKQLRPATLKSVRKEGSALIIKFDGVGSGLYIDGKRLRGLYIRSKRGTYTPAYAEILGKNVLKVYHPYIDKPAYVAYGVSSAEPAVNLFAGDFPVCPFCTEFKKGDKEVFIQLKSFVDPFLDGEWLCREISDTMRIAFRYPVFHQGEGELCFDSDFSLSGRSLRVIGEPHSPLSFSVNASPYHELDLYNYSAIRASLLNTKNLVATLKAELDGKTVDIVGCKGECRGGDWFEYEFPLDKIKKACDKITFCFRFEGDNFAPCTVNIDEIILVPKK